MSSTEEFTAVCDFCGATPVEWSHPARSFTQQHPASSLVGMPVDANSVGDWAACTPCHNLIEAGDIAGVTERSLETQRDEIRRHGLDPDVVRRWLTKLHRTFWAQRSGPSIPVSQRTPTPDDGKIMIEITEQRPAPTDGLHRPIKEG